MVSRERVGLLVRKGWWSRECVFVCSRGRYYSIVTHRKCIAKRKINPRISAVWNTTKQIAPFSCTPHVQEGHTIAEVIHLTPDLVDLGVLLNCHA